MAEEQSDIITMADMAAVFAVTDALGVDRELVRVELTKEDPGAVSEGEEGEIAITLPLSAPSAFMATLRRGLTALGYPRG